MTKATRAKEHSLRLQAIEVDYREAFKTFAEDWKHTLVTLSGDDRKWWIVCHPDHQAIWEARASAVAAEEDRYFAKEAKRGAIAA
jgi:lipocalin